MLTRRKWLRNVAGAATAVAAAPAVLRRRYRLFADSPQEYSARTLALMRRATVVDMLSPLLISPSRTRALLLKPHSLTPEGIQRYKDSGIHVFHASVGVGGREAQTQALRYFAGWNGFLAQHPDHFLRIGSAADFDRAKASGRVGVLLGLQNSEHFLAPDDVNLFYGLGQRVSQLTYNARNLIGNGCTERRDDGISDFGVSVVARMNQVGMVVDVSHCGDRTTLDACEVSKKPVLITHSNCRALVPNHPRCKTDEAIRAMAATGGVMGITGVRMFVRDREPTTIEHLVDHFEHVAKLVGVEHLGVGSDMDLDGYDKLPPDELKQLKAAYKESYAFRDKTEIEGLDHPRRMFNLVEALIRRGRFSDGEIELILGGNFRRALTSIWEV